MFALRHLVVADKIIKNTTFPVKEALQMVAVLILAIKLSIPK